MSLVLQVGLQCPLRSPAREGIQTPSPSVFLQCQDLGLRPGSPLGVISEPVTLLFAVSTLILTYWFLIVGQPLELVPPFSRVQDSAGQ